MSTTPYFSQSSIGKWWNRASKNWIIIQKEILWRNQSSFTHNYLLNLYAVQLPITLDSSQQWTPRNYNEDFSFLKPIFLLMVKESYLEWGTASWELDSGQIWIWEQKWLEVSFKKLATALFGVCRIVLQTCPGYLSRGLLPHILHGNPFEDDLVAIVVWKLCSMILCQWLPISDPNSEG